jgi:hypothetical protein
MSEIASRVYRPDPKQCCELCIFGRGAHARWCPIYAEFVNLSRQSVPLVRRHGNPPPKPRSATVFTRLVNTAVLGVANAESD